MKKLLQRKKAKANPPDAANAANTQNAPTIAGGVTTQGSSAVRNAAESPPKREIENKLKKNEDAKAEERKSPISKNEINSPGQSSGQTGKVVMVNKKTTGAGVPRLSDYDQIPQNPSPQNGKSRNPPTANQRAIQERINETQIN